MRTTTPTSDSGDGSLPPRCLVLQALVSHTFISRRVLGRDFVQPLFIFFFTQKFDVLFFHVSDFHPETRGCATMQKMPGRSP